MNTVVSNSLIFEKTPWEHMITYLSLIFIILLLLGALNFLSSLKVAYFHYCRIFTLLLLFYWTVHVLLILWIVFIFEESWNFQLYKVAIYFPNLSFEFYSWPWGIFIIDYIAFFCAHMNKLIKEKKAFFYISM
jgi:hypothetical protein